MAQDDLVLGGWEIEVLSKCMSMDCIWAWPPYNTIGGGKSEGGLKYVQQIEEYVSVLHTLGLVWIPYHVRFCLSPLHCSSNHQTKLS